MGGEEERRGNANEMQRGWHPTGKVLGNVVGEIVGKLRGGENLMQNANGQEKRQGCNLRSDGELRCPKWEEQRGKANEMQRGWHPTGKVLGNVVGGIVGKLRG